MTVTLHSYLIHQGLTGQLDPADQSDAKIPTWTTTLNSNLKSQISKDLIGRLDPADQSNP